MVTTPPLRDARVKQRRARLANKQNLYEQGTHSIRFFRQKSKFRGFYGLGFRVKGLVGGLGSILGLVLGLGLGLGSVSGFVYFPIL